MRVILFRHGPAESRDAARWPDDSQRPLTERGAERTREAASGLTRLEPTIGAILTSPYVRAHATARVLRQRIDDARVTTLDALRPGGSWRRILAALAERRPDETVVLVGHEPDLGKLTGLLVFGAPAPLPMKKAGACAIEFVGTPAAGNGRLLWFLPPRGLRRYSRRKDRV